MKYVLLYEAWSCPSVDYWYKLSDRSVIKANVCQDFVVATDHNESRFWFIEFLHCSPGA